MAEMGFQGRLVDEATNGPCKLLQGAIIGSSEVGTRLAADAGIWRSKPGTLQDWASDCDAISSHRCPELCWSLDE